MGWLRACYYPVKMRSYARHWKWWERVWHFANVPWNNSKAILSFEFFNIQVNIRVLTKVNVFHLWNTKCYIAKKKKNTRKILFRGPKIVCFLCNIPISWHDELWVFMSWRVSSLKLLWKKKSWSILVFEVNLFWVYLFEFHLKVFRSIQMYWDATQGNFRIHFSVKVRTNIDYESVLKIV